MNNKISETLLVCCALMLLNSNYTYASPFDDGTVEINKSASAEDIKESVKDKIADIWDSAKDKASDVKEAVADGWDAAKDKASEIKDVAADVLDSAKDKITDGAGKAKKKATSLYGSLTKKINGLIHKNEKTPDYVNQAIFLPGHESKEMVCQGIAYLPERVTNPTEQANFKYHNYVLLSYYPKDSDQPSQLVVVDRTKEAAVKRFPLYKSNGKAYTGHAGGIAVAGRYVWVASGNKIYGFELQEILDFLDDKTTTASAVKGLPDSFDSLPAKDLSCSKTYGVDSKASYVSFDGKYIWVGDFTKASNKDYKPVAHHKAFGRNSWIAGYLVDTDGYPTSDIKYTYTAGDSSYEVYKPDAVIAMRESVQGMAVCGDYVAMTISYGALDSKLAFYNNPLKAASEKYTYKPAGQEKSFTVDSWELENDKNWVNTVKLAAGAEDLEYDGKNLYVTFECSSKNYKQKWMNTNPTVLLTNDFYLINPLKAIESK